MKTKKVQAESRPTELPPLFKRTSTGAIQEWRIWVEPTNGGAKIVTRFGQQGGKLQTLYDEVTEGKNLGKKSETTPLVQAMLEAEACWRKQQDRKGYSLTVSGSEAIRAVSPMLAHVYADHADKVDWSTARAQVKYDGFRMLASLNDGEVGLRSREGKPITTMPHIVKALSDLTWPTAVILDGELYVHGMPFQKIASAIKKQKEAAVHAKEIKYHIYDVMHTGPFSEREVLRGDIMATAPSPNLIFVESERVRSHIALMEHQRASLEKGYEGSMLRHGTAGYETGKRSYTLLKVKTHTELEFKVTGFREGRGTHAGMCIFTCTTGDKGSEFEVTAPGTHEEKRAFLRNGAKYLGKKLTVKFQEWSTTEPPRPRFPVAIRFHETL